MKTALHFSTCRQNEAGQSQKSFVSPYNQLSPEDLLNHFNTRQDVHFFAEPDPVETQRTKIDAILGNSFEFNNETYRLLEPINWLKNPSQDIEWHILLHKFYYAVGLGMAYQETQNESYLRKWIDLISSWIDQAPPGYIASDVTGRRIQNWIYSYYYFVASRYAANIPAEFHLKLLGSIWEQTNYLCANLHPSRNHRTLELYAIFLAAVVFPEFRDAGSWRSFALDELTKNLDADFLQDGVHCEQSTDYHHLVLKNFLCIKRLAKLNAIPVTSRMDKRINQALSFSLYIHKPDGIVPSLSDGDARSFVHLLQQGYELYGRADLLYAATQGKNGQAPSNRNAAFPDSGYYVLRSGWGGDASDFKDARYLVFDCGPLGEGNHGHLDLLNIEVAAYGKSLIVDPGRYTYHENSDLNWRVLFRSTAYHNTVLIDRRNQTRYSLGKRGKYKIIGPAPQHKLSAFITSDHLDILHGIVVSHEYDAIHERTIFFLCGEYWIVSDVLKAQQPHQYEQLFHLSEHAQDRVETRNEQGMHLVKTPQLLVVNSNAATTSLTVDEGFVSYTYGEKLQAPILCFSQSATNAEFHTVLYPCAKTLPALTLSELPISLNNELHASPDAKAFRLLIAQDERVTTDYIFYTTYPQVCTYNFGPFQYSGRYLFLRHDAKGAIKQLEMDESSSLMRNGHRLSLMDNVLH